MTEVKIFIYGSFSEGLVHFDKIKNFIQQSEEAHITGSVYRLPVGFPVVIEQGTDQVPGTLVTLNSESNLLLTLLDEFHGFREGVSQQSLHFRKAVFVQTSNAVVEAFVYFLNPSKLPSLSKKIAHGDWRQSLQSQPALTNKINEKQKSYILRLGSTKGREIVPIDLPLYRELMSLELIVDKGRRLALSKLGQEVYRFLQ
jgi:gamma-glutamylcyclotransferase (GGCT)/AIG2-like uncharacterized protein YtfP